MEDHDIRGFRGFNELMGLNRLVIEGYSLIYQTIFTDNKILSLNHAGHFHWVGKRQQRREYLSNKSIWRLRHKLIYF